MPFLAKTILNCEGYQVQCGLQWTGAAILHLYSHHVLITGILKFESEWV